MIFSKPLCLLVLRLCFFIPPVFGQGEVHLLGINDTIKDNLEVGDVLVHQEPLEAIKYYQRAYDRAEITNATMLKATSLNKLGYAYYLLGEYPAALEYENKALVFYEKLKLDSLIGAQYSRIGDIYYFSEPRELEEAYKYYNKAFMQFNTLGYKNAAAFNLNNTGYVVWARGKKEEALAIHKEALKIFQKSQNKKGIAACLSDIGFTLNSFGKYKEALDYSYQALEAERLINDSIMQIPTLNNIGISYFKLGNYKQALEYSMASLKMAEERGMLLRAKEASELLAQVYEAKGDYKQAYVMHKKYKVFSDSLRNEERIKKMTQLNAKHKYEKVNRKRAYEQAKKDALVESEIDYHIMQRNSLTAVVGLLVVIAFISYRNIRIKNKNNLELSKKNAVITAQKQEVENKNKEITDSITYALHIQKSILPFESEIRSHFKDSFVYYKPKAIVSGDFFWFEHVHDKIYVAVADCTGHGIPGAMVSMVGCSALNRSLKEFDILEPGKILDNSRELVIKTFSKSERGVQDGMDVGICSIDKKNRKVHFSGANRPLYHIKAGGIKQKKPELFIITPNKQPVGIHEKMDSFTCHEVNYEEGDVFYLFSDGYADQFGCAENKKFMIGNFKKLLLDICHLPLEDQKSIIDEQFMIWKGALDQVDDITIFGFQV